ncbi:hypothetical protein ABIE27_001866 [Paenibacillus sp. 4624]
MLYIFIYKSSVNFSISDDNVNKSIAFSKIKTYYYIIIIINKIEDQLIRCVKLNANYDDAVL